MAWTLGPKHIINAIASAGSFLDGGGSRPLQRAAVPLMEDDHVLAETRALRQVFRRKRDLTLRRLGALGVHVDREPEGTFYVWADVRDLPPPLNTGMGLFRRLLEERVICVPGEFFDVNPGRRRAQRGSRFGSHVRISFGPDEAQVVAGLDRLAKVVAEAAR